MPNETTGLLSSPWDGQDDPHNPLNWAPRKKWVHITIMALLTFIVPLGATMFAPAVPEAVKELHIGDNQFLGPLTLSIYILGWTVGPLLLAPLSECHGRLAVYVWSGVLYVLFTAACAVSTSAWVLVIFRFLAGCVGSGPLTIGGGVISDLVPVQERGFALSLYMIGPILGPSIGPLVGGYLTAALGWRSIFWALAILHGVTTLAQVLFTQETYAPVILLARKGHGHRNLGSDAGALKQAFIRPAKLTVQSPTNMFISLVSAYINGLLFLLVATLPLVLGREYGFGPTGIGLAFEGVGVGNVLGLGLFATTSDRYVQARQKAGLLRPEDRLPPVLVAGPLVAAGFLWYGWTAQQHAHWILPIMGTSLIGMGNILFFSGIIGYLIDAFTEHAASAIAANIILRSLGGALLPLAGNPLYESLGWGWGSSVLAFVLILLTPGLVRLYAYNRA